MTACHKTVQRSSAAASELATLSAMVTLHNQVFLLNTLCSLEKIKNMFLPLRSRLKQGFHELSTRPGEDQSKFHVFVLLCVLSVFSLLCVRFVMCTMCTNSVSSSEIYCGDSKTFVNANSVCSPRFLFY